MSVHLMGAMLHRFSKTDHMKRVTLVEPLGPMTLPHANRAAIERGEFLGANVHLENSVATLILWGSHEGTFKLTCALIGPPGDTLDRPIANEVVEWPAGALSHRVEVTLEGDVQITITGRYAFKFLADGEPLCELAFPILWDDEVPE